MTHIYVFDIINDIFVGLEPNHVFDRVSDGVADVCQLGHCVSFDKSWKKYFYFSYLMFCFVYSNGKMVDI